MSGRFKSVPKKKAFLPKWREDSHKSNRRIEILNRLELYSVGKVGNVMVVPVFHGMQEQLVDEVCETGFANLGKTDEGYFGKGIYGTTQAEYAARVYGNGVCLLCFVSILNAFPVIYEDMPDLLGAGNYSNCDVHFVPVVPKNPYFENEIIYLATKAGDIPVYDELVVFQDAQIIPRFIIYYDKNEVKVQ